MTIKEIYIDRAVSDLPSTRRFLSNLGKPGTVVDNVETVYQRVLQHDDPVTHGKHVLFMTKNRGGFVRDCPGTRNYTCCSYRILHIGTYCTMDCAYCILQTYYHPPVLQYFVNHDDMAAELSAFFQQPGVKRIGTGEFTDSLIWEPWSDLTPRLVDMFANQDRAVLELKTKSTNIAKLENLTHRRKTIVSWSLNTERVIAGQERSTASLNARLRAASHCQSWGYPLAFHFDPMVIYPGCEQEYEEVIHRLFRVIDPENVVWISMGTFRFIPPLKGIIEQRFPSSRMVYGEFIPGLDGKMRYFKPLRLTLYRRVASAIQSAAPNTTAYYCMEDDEIWRESMGFTPDEKGGLPNMLDRSAVRICGLRE